MTIRTFRMKLLGMLLQFQSNLATSGDSDLRQSSTILRLSRMSAANRKEGKTPNCCTVAKLDSR